MKILDITKKVFEEDYLHKIIEILEVQDGRTFEEKKFDIIKYLKDKENALLANRLLEAAINDDTRKRLKKDFWQAGDRIQVTI